MLLDNHPQGPLDGLWAGAAAGGGMPALADPWNALDDGRSSGLACPPAQCLLCDDTLVALQEWWEGIVCGGQHLFWGGAESDAPLCIASIGRRSGAAGPCTRLTQRCKEAEGLPGQSCT